MAGAARVNMVFLVCCEGTLRSPPPPLQTLRAMPRSQSPTAAPRSVRGTSRPSTCYALLGSFAPSGSRLYFGILYRRGGRTFRRGPAAVVVVVVVEEVAVVVVMVAGVVV